MPEWLGAVMLEIGKHRQCEIDIQGSGNKCSSAEVGKLISQQSQISTVQRLKFLLRAKFFNFKLLLMPLLQKRLTQAVVFCGRATLKGPKSHM